MKISSILSDLSTWFLMSDFFKNVIFVLENKGAFSKS